MMINYLVLLEYLDDNPATSKSTYFEQYVTLIERLYI